MWDVMVALRGPDAFKSEGIKWYSTAVIRGIMSKAIRVGGTVNMDLGVVVLPWVGFSEGVRIETDWNWQHYIQHVEEAAHWLEIPVLHVNLASWWENRGLESRGKLGKIFLANVSPHHVSKSAVDELSRHVDFLYGKGTGYASID